MPLASAEGVLFTSDVDAVAKRISALGRRYVVVDGFSGAGESTFAESLAASLQLPWVELDSLLPPPEAVQDESYVERPRPSGAGTLARIRAGSGNRGYPAMGRPFWHRGTYRCDRCVSGSVQQPSRQPDMA